MTPNTLNLDATRRALSRAGNLAPARNDVTVESRQDVQSEVATTARSRSRSDWRYSGQLNQQLTAAQRALDFVDELAKKLEELKSTLSGELAAPRLDRDKLAEQVGSVQRQWQSRNAASGGSLDHRMQFRMAGDARQTFSIRGLDIDSLTSGQDETLVFVTGMPGAQPAAVKVGAQQGTSSLLSTLGRALGPSGIQPQLDEQGQLQFAVDEAIWQTVRDRFSLRGGGIRFPAGQPQHLRLDPAADSLQPAGWQVADHASARQTLQKVLRAIDQLQLSRQAIARSMAEVREAIAKLSNMSEQVWADNFVTEFNARFNRESRQGNLFEVVPALLGVSRYRVLSLLSLP